MLKRTNREYGGELAFDAFRGQAALPDRSAEQIIDPGRPL
jgi:hypothetical protein